MAVVFEGFSIREYAAKMRSVDVVKCWPFSGNADYEVVSKEDIEPLLPPITVTKFRWWSHELDVLRSTQNSTSVLQNASTSRESSRTDGDSASEAEAKEPAEEEEEKLDMICPVCRVFTAATVNAVNAHIDSCLAQASREERRQMRLASKGKPRAPKKRSIVEIFAVARQIEKVDDVNDEDLDGEGDREDELDCKNAELNFKMEKKKMKIVKKLKKSKNLKKALISNSKETTSKLKLQTPVKYARKLNDSACNKGYEKDIFDSVTVHRKKDLKCLSAQKKHKIVQASKLITKHQEPVISVRGILKTRKNDIRGQNAAVGSLQGGRHVNPCSIQHSDKHVRFSGKDDILGPSKGSVFSYEKNICNLYSDITGSSGKDQSTGSEKELTTKNGIDGDVTSINIENATGVQPVIEKDLFLDCHDCGSARNLLRPCITSQEKLKHLPEKCVSLSQVPLLADNLHSFDQANQITSCRPPYASIPKVLSALNDVSDPCANSQFHRCIPRASTSSTMFIDYFEDHSHGVTEMSSVANMRQFFLPSSSGFTLNESANVRLPSTAENMSGHAQYQSFPHLSTMEPTSSLCPLEWKQRAVSFRSNCMNEEFFGLPLNSQGELIPASSNGKGSLNQLKKSSLVTGSSCGLDVHNFDLQRSSMGDCSSKKERHFLERLLPKDHLNLFPVETRVKERPKLHLPARLGVAEPPATAEEDVHWLNSGGGSNHSICSLDSGQNLKNIFPDGSQVQNRGGNEVVHPKENSDHMLLNTTQMTMRLMGKDVAIVRSKEMQGFPDGKVWTDKEIISEHHSANSVLENLSSKSHFKDWLLDPASGKPNPPLEIQSSQPPESNGLMKATDPRFCHQFINCKNNPVSQNGSINRNHSTKLHHFSYPPTFPAMFDRATDFQEPFLPGPEILRVTSQLPARSNLHVNHELMDWSPADLKCKQNLPQATKSVINFPFLHPDCGEPDQQSWFQNSSKSLVPWLLHGMQVKTHMPPSQPFSDVDGKYHPHTTESTLVSPLVQHPPVAHQYNPMTSHMHIQSLVAPAPVVHPSFVSALSGIKPISSVNMGHRNLNKVKDRTLKPIGTNGIDHSQKTKKRPACKEGYSTKATKMPNLGIQEDISAITELTREDYGRTIQCNAGSSELNSNKDRASSSGCGPLEIQENLSAMTRLAREKFIQDMQYNDRPLALNSTSGEASHVGFGRNDSLSTGVRNSPGIDFSRVDGLARSGPIKLSAGAKHILKPCQYMDQDNSRLVHSTIPFATVPDTNSLIESQKKSTKVYRF